MTDAPAVSGAPPRKRRRPAKACEPCRNRKLRCDLASPCGPCVKSRGRIHCFYRPDARPKSPGVPVTGDASPRGPPKPSSSAAVLAPAVPQSSASHPATSRVSPAAVSAEPPRGRAAHADQSRHNNQPRPDLEKSQETIRRLKRKIEDLEQKLYDAPSGEHDQTPAKPAGGSAVPASLPGLRAQRDKVKIYGSSHWIHAAEKLPIFGQFDAGGDFSWEGVKEEFETTFRNLRSLRRTIKSQQAVQLNEPVPDLLGTLPARSVCDELVAAYLRTVEPVYRVVHVPSFTADYEKLWGQGRPHTRAFLLQLLLVLTVGSTFCPRQEEIARLRQLAQTWVYAAEWWLAGPTAKAARIRLEGVQVSCLLLIAQKTTALGNAKWVSSGALLHQAMDMGLHRDPAVFPTLPPFQSEMRKRLWATVVELSLQSAVDSAMPLLVSTDDFDTPPPSNVNDEDIGPHSSGPVVESPVEQQSTDTSVQIVLLKSLRLRMAVARLVNGLHDSLPYDHALRLGTELVGACQDAAAFFRSPPGESKGSLRAGDFHRRYIDLCLRKYVLLLYRPFVIQGRRDARLYFARKMCLETCTVIASYAGGLNLPAPVSDDLCRLFVYGSGFVRGGLSLDVITTLALELFTQLEEQQEHGVSAPMQDGSDPVREMAKAVRAPVVQLFEHIRDQLLQIILLGKPSLKSYGLLFGLLGHIKAAEGGHPVQARVFSTLQEAMKKCHAALMASGALDSPQESVDSLMNPAMTTPSDSFGFDIGGDPETFSDFNMGLDPLGMLGFPVFGEGSISMSGF